MIHLLAGTAILLTVNTFVWAAHGDAPAPEDERVVLSVHAHQENGGKVVDHCDHCCHAGAHMLALKTSESPSLRVDGNRMDFSDSPPLIEIPPSPPFIPPIA